MRVVDSDGDTSDPADLTIAIGDDGPSAVADTTSTDEDTPVTYNVLSNSDDTSDTQGADGATLTAASVQGGASVGSVSFASNGEITFTPAAGFEGPAVIDYTLTDGDGDTASSTLTVTVEPDATPTTPSTDTDPTTQSPVATVDEDGLAGGNAGGSGDVAGEDTVTTGTLGYSFGGDGAAASGAFSWIVASLPGDLKTADGRAVSFQLSSDGHTLFGTASDGSGGSEAVITIALTDQASGAYRATLHQALEHAAGNDENDLLFDATYTIVDADGSQADGTLSVVIDDDAPMAASDTNAITENAAPVSGNVIGGAGASSGDQADAPGADGASVTAVSEGSTTVSTLNADGKLVIQGQYGSLTLDADGGYTYALDAGNAEVAALDKGQTVDETFTYTLTDGDDDASDANLTITVTATDDDALVVGTNSDDTVQGGGGNDVLIGDTGGKYTVVEPAQNYNLSFILDTSGSMTAELGDTGKTRLEVAVEALKAKLDELATFEGTINVQILGFSDTVSDDENVEFLNLSPSSLDQVHAFLDGLTAEGNTNYQAAFEASGDWMKAQNVDDFNNVAYFLGDGSPNQNSAVNTSVTDTNRADITEGLKAYEELSAISQVEAIGIGSDVNREILKVFDNTADGGLELVPVPYDTGTLVGDKEFLATFDKDDKSVLGQLDKWTLNDPNGTGFLTIDRNNGNSLRIDDRGTDGSISATSAAFTIPEPTGVNQFYSLSFSYQTQIPTTASDGRFDNISWRLEKQTEDGEWDIVANDNDRSSTGGTEQVIANSLMGGTYRLVFVVENVASAQYVLEVHDISQSLYSYTDDELVPAGEDIIVNSAEEFETALDGGSSSDVPQEVGNDHLIGGAGDDILFGDQIEPAGIGGEAGSGYDGLVDHLTRQNGAEPTQEETLDFIKANYDKLIDKTRTDGGQDKLEGGQGDDQLFASANDDILIGGAGDDFLLGGLGSDTFKWNLGDAGSADAPALDVVSDFQVDPDADKLSLVNLLQDFDSSSTDPDQSALDNFVFAQEENGDTVLYIKSDGGLDDQHSNADQKITLDGVSMDGQSSEDFLTLLRNNRQLDVE